jgi:hypothetical protein
VSIPTLVSNRVRFLVQVLCFYPYPSEIPVEAWFALHQHSTVMMSTQQMYWINIEQMSRHNQQKFVQVIFIFCFWQKLKNTGGKKMVVLWTKFKVCWHKGCWTRNKTPDTLGIGFSSHNFIGNLPLVLGWSSGKNVQQYHAGNYARERNNLKDVSNMLVATDVQMISASARISKGQGYQGFSTKRAGSSFGQKRAICIVQGKTDRISLL